MSPTKSTAASAPLSERSPNTSSPTKPLSNSLSPEGKTTSIDNENIATMNEKPIPRFELPTQTKTTLGHAYGQGQTTTTYISPSDAIRSPTTKKLSEIKGKRYQNAKPQTLFTKTLSKQGLLKAQELENAKQNGAGSGGD